MRKRLAHALWILAIASLPLGGCNSHKDAAVGSTSHTTNTRPDYEGAATEMTAAGESADRAGAPASIAPASPVARKQVAGAPMQPMQPMPPPPPIDTGKTGEDYTNYGVNPMVDTAVDNLSTFAIDVDTASYAIARRKIIEGSMPSPDAVRVEEFVNYFKYDYKAPTDGSPFAVHMDAAPSPFHRDRHLLRVGVKAKDVAVRDRKKANLVFLVDVSGSMSSPDKLPLAKRAMRILVDNLHDGDTVSLVTYAGNTRVVLPPTDLANKAAIVSALEDLNSGGSTAMASGMELAYEQAAKNLGPGAESRVIVLSDGDANVGSTTHESILQAIGKHVKEGVTMSTIGFGMGNYKDSLMEQLANKGNGNYYYIDSLNQAKRVFQEQLGGTLEVVAKDVKIQLELDPKLVQRYRLVGYENRDIADQDFRNDKVDAGEIGAGHSVTALYELELVTGAAINEALATVRVRHKKPGGTKATEQVFGFAPASLAKRFEDASADLRFATAVLATAEILRNSPHAKSWTIANIRAIAAAATPKDSAERQEFLSLLDRIAPLHQIAAK